jgi:hypothetical protein
MTKKLIPAAALLVLFAAFSVFSQDKAADYSGNWKLDLAKSEMGERSRVESMEMTVTQTADELTVERNAKMAEGQGGGMGRGGMAGGAGKMAYSLTGKETKAPFGMGGEAKLKAMVGKGGMLTLNQERNIETQMGAMMIKTVENWELSENGKTLTVSSSTETPRGPRNQKMVFTKQ